MAGRVGSAAATALALCLLASATQAGPWLEPGDTGLRHDLQTLADAGILGTPLTAWPLSWGDISAELNAAVTTDLSDAVADALTRVQSRARDATGATGRWIPGALASAGTEPWVIRSFEDTPRAEGEVGAALRYTGDRFAINLAGRIAVDPDDGKEFRADGSYAGVALGNWMLAAAMTDRWWGPGWQGVLQLSNNARPIPAITLDRNSTAPFETRWLSWIGNWDFVTMWGFLEEDRAIPNAQFFAMRFTARPARWLEIGGSRTAMLCGDGRPCGFDTIKDMLLGNDNAGDNVDAEDEPGNQLAGYDVRLSGIGLGLPVAVYVQRAGEDEQDLLPARFLTQLGLEHWGDLGGLGSYRLYLEVSDTLCGGNIFGGGKGNCAYNHPIYETGMRYRGRSIGHSFDNDAEIWTLGAMLNDTNGGSWLLTVAGGDLNREGPPDSANTVTDVKKEYRTASVVHRRQLPIGGLQAVAGVESFEDPVTGDDDRDWRVSLNWHYDWRP